MEKILSFPSSSMGVKLNSSGFLAPPESAGWYGVALWQVERLETIHSAADWGDLDYLLIDLPPGTRISPHFPEEQESDGTFNFPP